MLGGRDGSTILQDNEVLFYPARFDNKNYELNNWEWAHRKMKNMEVWSNGVPETMKKLPIPLTGHCAVKIDTRFILVIGGGTNKFAEEKFLANSKPEPTNHIHLYDFDKRKWDSTFVDGNMEVKKIGQMNIPRMNHACLLFEEGGRKKIMVAGGVTKTYNDHNQLTNSAEIFDVQDFSWIVGADIPKFVTGSKFIDIDGRPTLVGRYGVERQQIILRYTKEHVWTELPVRLLHGRSDFQLLTNVPKIISVFPIMNSKLTKINPGKCATNNWQNVFGSVEKGKKAIFRTNALLEPWIQLDLGQEMNVVLVSTIFYL